MRRIIVSIVISIFAICALFAQGGPHSIFGFIQNADGSTPPTSCLTFFAYYLPGSDTLRFPEDSGAGEGTRYIETNGLWFVETSAFRPPPLHGQVVYIKFRNICNGNHITVNVAIDTTVPVQNVSTITMLGIGEDNNLPKKNEIIVFPNPFNTFCAIYSDDPVDIFDISGKKVRTLGTEGGKKMVMWDGRSENGDDLPTGIYFVNSATASKPIRIVLLK